MKTYIVTYFDWKSKKIVNETVQAYSCDRYLSRADFVISDDVIDVYYGIIEVIEHEND